MKEHESKKKYKAKNKNRKTIKVLLIVLSVLVAAAFVSIVLLMGIIDNDDASSLFIEKPLYEEPEPTATQYSAAYSPAASSEPTVTAAPGDVFYNGEWYVKNEKVVNLLFLGIDTNAQRKVDMMGYRSDMIMVCAVDVEAKKATLISIPRDTLTTVQKVDEDTGKITEVLDWKINTAYSYGGGASKYSFQNAMACVEMFLERRITLEQPLDFELDIPVYLYAGIDMDGIPHVAKSVGGVPVTLEKSIPGVGSKGQSVLLKYENAVLYLTNRHETGGDLDRNRRQQLFMLSLAKQIKDMNAPEIIVSLYDDLQKYVWTNLDSTQMLDLQKSL